MALALITGASGGIGEAFAELIARKGHDLILVARREGALNRLKARLEGEHEVSIQVLAADLGTEAGLDAVLAHVADQPVEMLVNNAGFGGRGTFVDRPLEDDLAMVDLNIRAVMVLCHRIGGAMAGRGKGRILNVGSTAGMMPGPLQATYFATKAFVNSFSQALDQELRERGVTVTVLAPGYVETDFAARADLDNTALTKSGRSAASVARIGYDAMLSGQLLVVNETMLSVLLRWVLPFVPRRMVLKLVHRLQTK